MATEAHGATIDETAETQSGKSGIQIYTNKNCRVISLTVELGGSTDATKVYILDVGQKVLTSAAIVGTTAKFSNPLKLTAGRYYYLAADNNGSNYNLRRPSLDTAYPYAGTAWNWTTGLNHNGNTGGVPGDRWLFNIVSAEYQEVPETEIGPGGIGTRVIRTSYPCTDGLSAGITTQVGHKEVFIAQDGTFIPQRKRKGL